MKTLSLRDKKSCLALTGKVEGNTVWTKINSLNELIFNGEITAASEKDGRYEIAGLSLNGRPAIEQKENSCLNCTDIWKGCDTCRKAERDKQWFILPEGAKVSYQFAR